jgi:hypothetical protein
MFLLIWKRNFECEPVNLKTFDFFNENLEEILSVTFSNEDLSIFKKKSPTKKKLSREDYT